MHPNSFDLSACAARAAKQQHQYQYSESNIPLHFFCSLKLKLTA
jgi:hypothetical protein